MRETGGEGGLTRSLRELPANMPLRGCVGRTGFSSSTALGEKTKGPVKGPFHFLAERVAKISLPGKSEEVQNPFTILHLGNFMR